MSGLRTDERQWLIYDEEALGAVMRGLEAFYMFIASGPLARDPDDAIRAIAHFGRRVAQSRIEEMKKNDGAQREMAHNLEVMFKWIGMRQKGMALPRPKEVDDIYAAVFRLDSRAQSAGVVGPGVHRIAVRGD